MGQLWKHKFTDSLKFFLSNAQQRKKMLEGNKQERNWNARIQMMKNQRKNLNQRMMTMTFHTIQKIYLLVGMENLFLTGFISCMDLISHTNVKSVEITRTKDLKHFKDISPSGDMLMVCDAWVSLTLLTSQMSLKLKTLWHFGRNSKRKNPRRPLNQNKKKNSRTPREM